MPKRDENTGGFWTRACEKIQQIFAQPSDSMHGKGRRRLAPLQELEDRCLLSATPVGAEFRVNTHTQGAQQTFPQTPQAVAKNVTTGDYVIVWASQGQNGGTTWDVYMQRYNAAGVPQGGETLVNTHVNGVNQQYASVAITPNNWNVVQMVTVTGQDDHIVNGNVTYTITGAAVSADVDYNGVAMPDVTVVNKERDVAAINVTPKSGLVLNAANTTANFDISLASKPSANVTIPLSSSIPQASVSRPFVTFTPADWNVPQTVTVDGKNISAGSANTSFSVMVGSAVSTDMNYAGKIGSNVNLTFQSPLSASNIRSSSVLTLLAAPANNNAPPNNAPANNVNPQNDVTTSTTSSNTINNGPTISISTTISPVSARPQIFTALAPSARAFEPQLTVGANNTIASSLGSTNRGVQIFAPISRAFWEESAGLQVVTVMPAERDPAFETFPSHAPTMQPAQFQSREAPTDFVLDVLNDAGERIPWKESTEESTTLFTTGLAATTGYVLLNTRVGVWMLSLLTSQPLWRQFDPLEVLYAWEEESERAIHETEDEETLVSLVD